MRLEEAKRGGPGSARAGTTDHRDNAVSVRADGADGAGGGRRRTWRRPQIRGGGADGRTGQKADASAAGAWGGKRAATGTGDEGTEGERRGARERGRGDVRTLRRAPEGDDSQG